MSTQTMRAPPRRVSASNKRKEPEDPGPDPPSPAKAPNPMNRLGSDAKLRESVPPNQLLAGYLAHEYLTRGTLFGKNWRPDLVEPAEPKSDEYRSYVEVSGLLKGDGAHLPGVVNPRQLSGFFHM